ncbi:unnamed protein product, partial [Discosporangium mesarthrocarpum]
MANLESEMVVNDSPVPLPAPPPKSGNEGKTMPKSGEDGRDVEDKSASQRKNGRKKLLAVMVAEDRESSRKEGKKAQKGERNVHPGARPTPPRTKYPEGMLNQKVRLEVCAEKKKDGMPDTGNKKIVVISRSEPLEKFMDTMQGKLHMKKKPKAVGLVEAGEITDWLENLSWVQDGCLLCIVAVHPAKPSKVGGSSNTTMPLASLVPVAEKGEPAGSSSISSG